MCKMHLVCFITPRKLCIFEIKYHQINPRCFIHVLSRKVFYSCTYMYEKKFENKDFKMFMQYSSNVSIQNTLFKQITCKRNCLRNAVFLNATVLA